MPVPGFSHWKQQKHRAPTEGGRAARLPSTGRPGSMSKAETSAFPSLPLLKIRTQTESRELRASASYQASREGFGASAFPQDFGELGKFAFEDFEEQAEAEVATGGQKVRYRSNKP